MSNYRLAQLNIAALKAPLDSPELKDFVDNLDRINALAEDSAGFVWRLKGDGNDATSLRPLGEDVIVNHEPTLDPAPRSVFRKSDELDGGHKEVDVAIHAAFDVARRRLEDVARRQRGDVKTRAAAM